MSMKKRNIVYIGLLVVLAGLVLWLYNAFNGNPASAWLGKKELQRYLHAEYPDKELVVRDGIYDFKFRRYRYETMELGTAEKGEDAITYKMELKGFFPKVVYDGIHYASLDTALSERLSEEARAEIAGLLAPAVAIYKEAEAYLEIEKGELPADTVWSRDLKLQRPLYLHIVLDATEADKEEVWEAARQIQTLLRENGYAYGRVNINANGVDANVPVEKAAQGYLKFAVAFGPDSKLKLQDVRTFNGS